MVLNINRIERDRGAKILFKETIPYDAELNKTRAFLTLVAKNQAELLNINGVSLITPAAERPRGEGCGIFLLSTYFVNVGEVLLRGDNISGAEPNSFAFYFDRKGNLMHTGIVMDDSSILSKWEWTGGVFLHRPELVPLNYGNTIIRFRPPKNNF